MASEVPAAGQEKIVSEVVAALSDVKEPLTGLGLLQVGFVGTLTGRLGSVEVEFRLPCDPEDYPFQRELETMVRDALVGSGLALRVRFRSSEMDSRELKELAQRLREASVERRGASPVPFLKEDTRIFVVASGKGGVGKSTVAVNLACALAQHGSVGLLDADVYGYSVSAIASSARAPVAVEDVLLPLPTWGVRMVSPGHFLPPDQPVLWRGPMLHKAITQLIEDVYWAFPDFLLIDTPPGTGDVLLSLSQTLGIGEVLVVTTPQRVAASVAFRSGKASKELKVPVVGVIENMSFLETEQGPRSIFGSGGGQVIADQLGVPLLASIPILPELAECGDEGVPVVEKMPDSRAAQIFKDLAMKLARMPAKKRVRKELQVRSAD